MKFEARINQSFLSRSGIIFAGSILGQGFAFIMLPYVAQIYDASILGRAATILAIMSISALIVCLQYDQAIVVASDSELPYLLILASSIIITFTILVGCIIVIDSSLNIQGKGPILAAFGINWILPVLILVYGFFTLLVNLGLRQDKLISVSVGRAVYYGGGSLLQVIGGLIFGAKENVFLLAQSSGAILAILCLIPYKKVFTWARRKQSFENIIVGVRRVAITYLKFPKYQMGSGFINAVSIYLPVIFMRVAFSDAWAGWYFMAWRLLVSPVSIISQAVGQVFYRDSAERERTGIDQNNLFGNVVATLIRISLLPALAVGIYAPIIIDLVLGEGWKPVAGIIQVLLIATTITFFTSPVSLLLNVKGRQAGALFYNSILFLVRFIGLFLGWWVQSAMGAVWAYSLFSALILFVFLNYIAKSLDSNLWLILKRTQSVFVDTVLLLAIGMALWFVGALYLPIGLIVISFGFGFAAYRDLKRGGWRRKHCVVPKVG